MEKTTKVLWGLVFIIIGIIVGTNSLGITNIDLFFDGWWTLLIIVPCFIGLFDKSTNSKTTNIVGVIIGIVLLLAARDILSFELIWKLMLPVILVGIGISMIYNETIKSNITEKVKEGKKIGLESIAAVFAGQKVIKESEFKGANLDAVFGGLDLDIRNCIIDKEAVIKASAIFGGIDILVPNNVNIKVKSTPIFGGVSNKTTNNSENANTIYIDAFCMFGGIDIK